ncbi:MAG: TetR/AcrR family transcriptional regulator, partial [Bradymonadaceae bacterium]
AMTIATEIRDETLPALDETDFPQNAKRMMRAGIHLFAQKGFAGTSVREIVQAADVTNPMLYYYFDNKEGLYNTLITYLFEHMTGLISARLAEAATLEEAVDAVILAHFEGCKRSPVALRFVYMVLFGPEDSAPDFDMFDRAAQRGKFESHQQFAPHFLTDLLLGLINQHLMQTLKRIEAYSDRTTRRQKMREMMSEANARAIRQFFFSGAGHLKETCQ